MENLNDKFKEDTIEIFKKIKKTLESPPYRAFIGNTNINEAVISLCNRREFYESSGIPYTDPNLELVRAAILTII